MENIATLAEENLEAGLQTLIAAQVNLLIDCGSLYTIHAETAEPAIDRLTIMVFQGSTA